MLTHRATCLLTVLSDVASRILFGSIASVGVGECVCVSFSKNFISFMNEFLLRYATLYAMNMSKYAEAYMHVIEKLICSIEGKSNFLCKSLTEWAKC